MLVAFESTLCDRPPAEITCFIAHEFAHVFLGRATNEINADEGCEIQADERVIRWGFAEELKASSFNYIYRRKRG